MSKFTEVNKNSFIHYTLIVAAILVFAAAVGTAGYFYWQYKTLSSTLSTKDEINSLTGKISAFMILPKETPTLATVTDPKKLQGQTFFANAKTGDKVLIYLQAKKALLYRPSTNKIIDFAPVNTIQASPTPTTNNPSDTIQTTPTPSVSGKK